jgi:hypothetical protein
MANSLKLTLLKPNPSPEPRFQMNLNSQSQIPQKLINFDSKFNLLTTSLPKLPHTTNSTPVALNKLTSFESTKNLIWQDIQESLGLKKTKNGKNSFHKAKEFIERKQKIKKNVKDHKYNSSEKLRKLKSIIQPGIEIEPKDFLTSDDLLNDEGSYFLNLNKRNFGESQNPNPKFKNTKKLNCNLPGKLNNRNSSLPELPYYKSLSPHPNIDIFPTRKSSETPITEPVSNYIQKEMKKMWPPDSENISKKKQKNLKFKVEKLAKILEENPKVTHFKKNSKRELGDKLKRGSIITKQYKKLRKKLELLL